MTKNGHRSRWGRRAAAPAPAPRTVLPFWNPFFEPFPTVDPSVSACRGRRARPSEPKHRDCPAPDNIRCARFVVEEPAAPCRGRRNRPLFATALSTSVHAVRRDVTPDDTRRNRTSSARRDEADRTARNSPDAGTEIFRRFLIGDGPRATLGASLRRAARMLFEPESARADADTALFALPDREPWSGISRRPDGDYAVEPLSRTPGCRNANANAKGRTSARSPAAGMRAAPDTETHLAKRLFVNHLGSGPREGLLPKVKSRRGAATPLRGVFLQIPTSKQLGGPLPVFPPV